MICNKCNHKLPDDSKFCQYCGNKIEKVVIETAKTVVDEPKKDETPAVVSVAPVADDEPSVDAITPDEALNALLKMQAKNTIEAMVANSKTQPDNEGDADFGLVPEKPIYTLAIRSVDGEIDYLNKLYTDKGEKITWHRRGSVGIDGINGLIDVYDTYLSSGKLYKTIYINMYGAKTSTTVPKGFLVKKSGSLPQRNNNSDFKHQKLNVERGLKKSTLISYINIAVAILSIVSIISIVIAMNVQDYRRNYLENWNTTTIYFVLLIEFVCVFFVAIYSYKVSKLKFWPWVSLVLVITTLFIAAEGSVFSSDSYDSGYNCYVYYGNMNIVTAFNSFWVIGAILIFAITLLPEVTTVVKIIKMKWCSRLGYREKQYKRVALMHSYLDKGIISEEEYEKVKKDIMKNIK